MVFPDLNVAENIFITHRTRSPFVNWGKLYRDAENILKQLDVKLDVRQAARGLTLAAQQTVEIAKAISLKVRVLIMDEPTASLSAHEVNQLFKLARTLRQQGVAILFITHRMDEVFEIADRVSVFRDGKWISTKAARPGDARQRDSRYGWTRNWRIVCEDQSRTRRRAVVRQESGQRKRVRWHFI